jgi:hypothetical protein
MFHPSGEGISAVIAAPPGSRRGSWGKPRSIRGVSIVSVAGPSFDPFAENVRAIARLSRTEDPAYPFRVTVRLRNGEEVARFARSLVRFASAE